jgi:hypothetical protein
MLAYSLVLGGKGVIARFQFIPTEPVDNSRIEVFSNPVHDTFLVLADRQG